MHRGNLNTCMWIKYFFNRINRRLFWNSWDAASQVTSNGDAQRPQVLFTWTVSHHVRGQAMQGSSWHQQGLWATAQFWSKTGQKMSKSASCEISPLSPSRDHPGEDALENCQACPVTSSPKNWQMKAESKQKVWEMREMKPFRIQRNARQSGQCLGTEASSCVP